MLQHGGLAEQVSMDSLWRHDHACHEASRKLADTGTAMKADVAVKNECSASSDGFLTQHIQLA